MSPKTCREQTPLERRPNTGFHNPVSKLLWTRQTAGHCPWGPNMARAGVRLGVGRRDPHQLRSLCLVTVGGLWFAFSWHAEDTELRKPRPRKREEVQR